jgi:ATP-dependent DNA helicase RecG
LELDSTDELRPIWLDRLLDMGLVASTGRTQAVRYFVSPDLLKGSGLDEKTTLRRLEPHRLRALIVEDLARYAGSSSADVHRRTAPELALRTVRRALEDLVEQEQVRFQGDRRWRRYWLGPKGQLP